MSKVYHRPLLVFYLEEPPKKGDRGKDFRTLPGEKEALYSPVLDALLRDIKGRQSILKSLLEDSEAERLPFVGSTTLETPVRTLSEWITKQLNFELKIFREQRTIEEAFSYLRFTAESSRIFILLVGNLGSYHTNIPTEIFRGFAMADEIAPLVVVNDNDALSAWSFTALHEIAHLWLGATGLSGWVAGQPIEQYCSDVAAEILLPPVELEEFAHVGKPVLDELAARMSRFADRRNISRAMVAYRVFRTGAITERTWQQLRDRFYQDWIAQQERQAARQRAHEGGPSYYVVKRHRLGKALLGIADRSIREGLLTYTRAAKLLGVKARNVEPLLSGGTGKGGE
ncbi:MAG TPA: ImmA/IrrE family metallo-endopeptidase [Terriglobales bacterium]|nr:ImmA/IrrE family metallo-endopeptidase [Terriglobales bacterium]